MTFGKLVSSWCEFVCEYDGDLIESFSIQPILFGLSTTSIWCKKFDFVKYRMDLHFLPHSKAEMDR